MYLGSLAQALLIVVVFPFFEPFFDYPKVKRIGIIAFVLIALNGYAQQFRFENYSVSSGLPQSQVYCQLQDKHGFLWLGTMGGGVAKFDGQRFTTFTTQDKLPNNFVHCLFEYQDTIWIGTQKGLCFYDGSQFTTVSDSALAGQHIVSFYKDSTRTLVGTSSGIYEALGSQNFVNILPNFNISKQSTTSIFKDNTHRYWIGGSKGVLRYNPYASTSIYKQFSRSNGLATNDIECFVQLADSTILVGTYGAGVYQIKAEKIQPYSVKSYTGNAIVHDFLLDDKLWIGTQRSGLLVVDIDTRDVQVITQRDGLANNHVRTLLKDDWGTYWIGTSGGGVSKYFGQSFVHYTTQKGLPGNYIYSLYEDVDENLWMGVSDVGVVKRDANGFTHFGKDSGFVNQKVKAIAQDKLGRIWIGTLGKGLYTYDGNEFRRLPFQNGLKGRFVKGLVFDGSAMWSATIDEGIFSINATKGKQIARQYSMQQGVQSNRINALCMFDGKMWYGCQSKGVGYVSRGAVTDLLAAGLPSWSVRAMRADERGNLWIATGGSGVIRLYADSASAMGYSFEEYGYDQGMLSTNIYTLQLADGKVYCGSQNGIDELTLNNEFDVIETMHYGYDEGFVGVETCQNAALQDKQGNLWFGTVNGLSQFKPNTKTNQTQLPKLDFTDVSVNLLSLPVAQLQEVKNLKYDENTLSFAYQAVDLKHPKRLMYSYMLEGVDRDWSVPATGSSVRYASLGPGEYTFKVRASNDNLNWTAERVFTFHVATAFWKTQWFWLLIIGVILGSFYLLFRYRLKTLEQKAEEENLKYQLKNELLLLEQKALRLQMNPHFLFNALNSIQGLIIKNDQKGARYYLAKFAHLMRQILENSQHGSISLEEELKTLENYLLIEKLSKKDTFDYHINTSDTLNLSTTQIPPMLIQPFVENAIIHAFTGKDEVGEISIDLSQEKGMLCVVISDNGIGRAKAGEISKKGVNRRSVGIEVTEQRLIAHNGDEGQSINIIDVVNKDKRAMGTRVELKIRVE